MRLEADPSVASWLQGLTGAQENFDWDAGNRLKNRKHRVEDEAIESLLRGSFALAGRVVEPTHDELRWLLLGRDATGRHLALVFTRRGDKIRSISCRPMRRPERRLYEEAIG